MPRSWLCLAMRWQKCRSRCRGSEDDWPPAFIIADSIFGLQIQSKGTALLDFLGDLRRSHMCGELRLSDSGKKAVLMGWVGRRRDLGSIIFIDLRDRTGITQVVFNREKNPAAHDKAEQLRNEFVIAVTGTVKQRDAETINKNIPTGEVELVVEELRILNVSKQPPFLPSAPSSLLCTSQIATSMLMAMIQAAGRVKRPTINSTGATISPT